MQKSILVFSSRAVRGGRITKHKGTAASFSPQIGLLGQIIGGGLSALAESVSPVALGTAFRRVITMTAAGAVTAASVAAVTVPALMLTTSGAVAACDTGPNTFICSGAETDTRALNGTPLDVTLDDTFTIDTTGSGGNAIDLSGTGGLELTQAPDGLAITGEADGINTYNKGSGATDITVTGIVTGTNGFGIRAYNEMNTTDLTINAGSVHGGNNQGIYARNNGTGALTITASGAVTGSGGIRAVNFGTDGLFITAEGAITSAFGPGIYASNNVGGDVIVEAQDAIVASGGGILVRNSASDAMTMVTAAGNIESINGDAIRVSNSGANSDLTIIAQGDLYSTSNGIHAEQLVQSDSSITIMASGAVTGQSGWGIYASNAGTDGLFITTQGVVTGNAGDGIFARNRYGGDLVVDAQGTVTGYSNGILAEVFADASGGNLTVKTASVVTGGIGDGISGSVRGDGNLVIEAEDAVKGGDQGIYAKVGGSGNLSITTEGTVTGDLNEGIYAENSALSGDLTINAAAVSGGTHGIFAKNNGTGALSITASGAVTGTDRDGIFAENFGKDGLSVTVEGVVTGGYDGIFAKNNNGGDMFVEAQDAVTGNERGIFTQIQGSGNLTVIAAGAVKGGAQDGIFGQIQGGNGNLVIEAGADVEGGNRGIFSQINGSGNLTVTAAGAVTGLGGEGIFAQIQRGNGNLVIEAQDAVTGDSFGIFAQVFGSGDLTITAAGPVTGLNRDGIFGQIQGDGQLTITAQDDVVGSGNFYRGIFSQINGSGDLTVTTQGSVSVSGIYSMGIFAQIGGETGDLTIIAQDDVSSSGRGIFSENRSNGSTSVTTAGTVTGDSGYGIFSTNFGTDLTIDAQGDVSGGTRGIFGQNQGTGDLIITNSGTVIGTEGEGIFGLNESGSSTDLTLNVAGDVTGGTTGVYGLNKGSGLLSSTVSAVVTGGNGTAILLNSVTGSNRLELQSGWKTVGETISYTREDSRLVFGGDEGQSGFDMAYWDDGSGTHDGTGNEFFGFDPVLLKEDDSTFVLTDSNGDGDDTTSIKLEEASITGGTLALDRGAFDDMTIQMTGADAFTIEEEGTLAVYSDSDDGSGFGRIEGSLNNYGALDLSTFDMGAGTRFEVTENYIAGSSLIMDTTLDGDLSPTDMLIVGGDTSGTTDVTFNVLSGAGAVTDTGIQIVDVDGNSDGEFIIANPDATVDGIGEVLIAGAYGYRLTRGDDTGLDSSNDWFLKSTLPDGTPLYQPAAPVYEALPAAMAALNSLSTLQQRAGNRYWNSDAPAMMDVVETETYDDSGAAIEQNAVWMRIEGAHASIEPDHSTSLSSYDVNAWQLRMGLDLGVLETEDGKLVAGMNVAYGQSSLDSSSMFGNGDIDIDGYSLAGTLTWYGDSGFYADAQAQYSWFGSDLSSDALVQSKIASDVGGNGTAVSLELGQRIKRSETLTLIPQAQLVWSRVDFNSFTGPNGEAVSLGDGESLKGRVGLAAEHASSWQADNGMTSRASVYGLVNINHEFLDGTSVNVSGVNFSSEQDAWTGDIGVGGTYNWNDDKFSFFGEASYGTSLSNPGDSYALKGNAGFRLKW